MAGRDHWEHCYSALVAGGGIRGGRVVGESDRRAERPHDRPVTPADLAATVYHAVGISPNTIVYNHLNQPRELVKAEPVTKLFA